MNYFKAVNVYLKKEEPAYIRYLYNCSWYFLFIKILMITGDYISALILQKPYVYQVMDYVKAAPIRSIIALFAFHAWKVALPILAAFILKFWIEREKIFKK